MLRKVRLVKPKTQPLPRETFLLAKTRTGDDIVVWNSVPYPQDGSDEWLLGERTEPVATEPTRSKRQDEESGPLALRLCDCGLAQGAECCCPMR